MKEDSTTDNNSNQHIRLIQLCNRKLEMEPNCKKAILLRANVYIKLNQSEQAMRI